MHIASDGIKFVEVSKPNVKFKFLPQIAICSYDVHAWTPSQGRHSYSHDHDYGRLCTLQVNQSYSLRPLYS